MIGETLSILLDADATGLQNKITDVFSSISKTIHGVSLEKLNWNTIINANALSSLNWSSIVSKLFSPANLIAFFSAMAATGIIASIQSQAAGSMAAGQAGLTTVPGAPSPSEIGKSALQIRATTSPSVGSAQDFANALARITAYVKQFGGSAADAETITKEFSDALFVTGGTIGNTLEPMLELLQNSGATTSDQIKMLIGNLMSAAQASGGALSMASAASNTQDFALAAVKAGVSFEGINKSIVRFGAESKINIRGAVADIKLLADEVSGNVQTLAVMGTSHSAVVKQLSTNANTAFDNMEATLSKMSPSILATLTQALGIDTTAAQAAVEMSKWKDNIDRSTSALVSLSGKEALGKVLDQYSKLDTASNKIEKIMAQIKSDFSSITLGKGLSMFFALVDNLVSQKGAIIGILGAFAALGTAGFIGAISWLSKIPALAGLTAALPALTVMKNIGLIGLVGGVGYAVGSAIGKTQPLQDWGAWMRDQMEGMISNMFYGGAAPGATRSSSSNSSSNNTTYHISAPITVNGSGDPKKTGSTVADYLNSYHGYSSSFSSPSASTIRTGSIGI